MFLLKTRLQLCLSIALLACVSHATAHTNAPFTSPIANPYEARIGSMYQVEPQKLRLDIGTQLEVLSGTGFDTATSWSAGVGFQTWTRLRAETNFKFPVETVDYWFGVHGMYGSATSWHVRARIAHISSHLVDGLANRTGVLSPTPFVFSREFVELLGGYSFGVLRPYAGTTVVWSSIPDAPNSWIPQGGVDIRMSINSDWTLAGGYDVKLVGILGTYSAVHAAQLGIQRDLMHETALWLGLYGYHGRSMHGMFYTGHDSYVSLGFQILW